MYRSRLTLTLVLLLGFIASDALAISSRQLAKIDVQAADSTANDAVNATPVSTPPPVQIGPESLQAKVLPTPPTVVNEATFIARPTPTPAPIVAPPAAPAAQPAVQPSSGGSSDCGYGEVLTPYRGYGDWYRTLLDLRYMVPADYRPSDLVPVTDSGARTGTYGVSYARSLTMPDLTALVNAVRDAGFGQLQINTAFRDYAMQTSFWNSYRNGGGGLTYPTTLPPGHSEHQLGTTFDFNVYAAAGLNSWMTNNAWKYGFVKSFPPGRNAEHCIGSEDWHYRYLGRDMASNVMNSGLTIRGYLLRLLP
jgi:D-alanyl-D-alanine carboxypeptidase